MHKIWTIVQADFYACTNASNFVHADNFLCTAEIVVHSSSQILQWLSKSTLVVVVGEQFSLCSASHHHRSLLLLRVGEGAKLIRLVHACKITKLCTFSNFSSLLWSWHRRPISMEKRGLLEVFKTNNTECYMHLILLLGDKCLSFLPYLLSRVAKKCPKNHYDPENSPIQ